MRQLRLIGVALLVVFVFGAMVAASAQAETAPYWAIGGTRLVAGKTHNVNAKQVGKITLSTPAQGIKIGCTGLFTDNAVLLGSNAGNPGKGNEFVTVTGCTLENSGFPECELANAAGERTTTLTTNPLRTEQVMNVASGAGGNELLEELVPASAAAGVIDLHFIGPCPASETLVSGQVVGLVTLDRAGEQSVELGQAAEEATSWLLKLPTTPIKEVWLISNGTGKVQKIKLTAFGEESVEAGTLLTLLANTKFEAERGAFWSPLP